MADSGTSPTMGSRSSRRCPPHRRRVARVTAVRARASTVSRSCSTRWFPHQPRSAARASAGRTRRPEPSGNRGEKRVVTRFVRSRCRRGRSAGRRCGHEQLLFVYIAIGVSGSGLLALGIWRAVDWRELTSRSGKAGPSQPARRRAAPACSGPPPVPPDRSRPRRCQLAAARQLGRGSVRPASAAAPARPRPSSQDRRRQARRAYGSSLRCCCPGSRRPRLPGAAAVGRLHRPLPPSCRWVVASVSPVNPVRSIARLLLLFSTARGPAPSPPAAFTTRRRSARPVYGRCATTRSQPRHRRRCQADAPRRATPPAADRPPLHPGPPTDPPQREAAARPPAPAPHPPGSDRAAC